MSKVGALEVQPAAASVMILDIQVAHVAALTAHHLLGDEDGDAADVKGQMLSTVSSAGSGAVGYDQRLVEVGGSISCK